MIARWLWKSTLWKPKYQLLLFRDYGDMHYFKHIQGNNQVIYGLIMNAKTDPTLEDCLMKDSMFSCFRLSKLIARDTILCSTSGELRAWNK